MQTRFVSEALNLHNFHYLFLFSSLLPSPPSSPLSTHSLKHSNLVKLYNWSDDGAYVCVVYEFMAAGSLFDCLCDPVRLIDAPMIEIPLPRPCCQPSSTNHHLIITIINIKIAPQTPLQHHHRYQSSMTITTTPTSLSLTPPQHHHYTIPSLQSRIGSVGSGRRLMMATQTASALHYLHNKHIVHTNVKRFLCCNMPSHHFNLFKSA